MATGKTREEALRKFRDALLGLWDYQRGPGEKVPVVTALEIRETREIATLETRLAAAA